MQTLNFMYVKPFRTRCFFVAFLCSLNTSIQRAGRVCSHTVSEGWWRKRGRFGEGEWGKLREKGRLFRQAGSAGAVTGAVYMLSC